MKKILDGEKVELEVPIDVNILQQDSEIQEREVTLTDKEKSRMIKDAQKREAYHDSRTID